LTRFLNLFLAGVLVVSAIGVYSIKYEATRQAERVAKLRRAIDRERIAIGTLRAEWAHLAQPERLTELAERHLDLQPMKIEQVTKAADLPARTADQDQIAEKLEGLGLGGPITGSTGSQP
jgi:cell division protein FtsL